MPSRRLAALPALLVILAATLARAAGRPNIVVILSDDQGWNDTSVDFGLPKARGANDHYRTPNLERLASEGVRLGQAYAAPVCSPTRVSLLTGLSVAHHGVTNWTLAQGKDLGVVDRGVALPDWNCGGLQPRGAGVPRSFERAETLPELLRAAGYRTIHVGKAHLGAIGTPGADPRNLGFDVNIAGTAMGHPASHLGTRNFGAGKDHGVPDLAEYHGKDITLAQALTDRAIAEMERAKADGKPFFLHLAHYAVHAPIEPADEFGKVYAGAGLGKTELHYAEMVSDVDASVGRVCAALERLGVARDTIVIFLSDNGGFAQRGGAGFKPLNLPLRSGKGSAYEGGIRTPMIVRWPGVAKAGLLTQGLARVEDLLPTLVAAAGGKVPGDIDGADLSPLLRGETRPTPAYTWYYPHVWGAKGPGIEPFAAIREGDLKAIVFFVGDRLELYNLANDPGETRNLAAERPQEALRLKEKLLASLKASGREPPRQAGGR